MREAEVVAVLARRDRLRKDGDFEAADALRQGLWEAGVRVDDKQRKWYYVSARR